jgi:dTDP-4-dehydrorhamnose 3,5-epimerase
MYFRLLFNRNSSCDLSAAAVLRGVHVHRRHVDYLTLVSGTMRIGLCDLRQESPTYRLGTALDITPSEAILIPPGVAHGFISRDHRPTFMP